MSLLRWAGIIAAGAGSRLKTSHPHIPKPLVSVGGKPLAHWVVASLRAAGIDSLIILLNSSGDPVREYLERNFPDLAWTFLRADTASSWESFRIVAHCLAEKTQGFLMSTADALIRPEDVARFSHEAFAPWQQGPEGSMEPEASLALTSFVDDEKPLWAEVGPTGRITALGPHASKRAVTCGLYALKAETAFRRLEAHHERLRDFWAALVNSGARVRGVMLGQTVDVDRPEDISAAEKCFK